LKKKKTGKEDGKMPRGLYKRGNIWWLRYAGLDGKTVYESSGTDKVREAEALLHKRKANLKEGKQSDVKKIANRTFRELADEYKVWAERQRCFSSKIYLIERLVQDYGNIPLRRFNSMLVEQYQTQLMKDYKPASVNRIISCLKHMITKAVDWQMVEEETLRRVRKVKLLEENNRRLRYLSKEECSRLIDACADHLRPIVITALNTGMRKDEVLSLKWDSIDLRHGFILLDRTKNGERREIPINQTVRDILSKIMRRVDVPYAFHDRKTGKRYQDVKTGFKAACRRSGIKDFHFHDLRHTFASQLVMAGVDLTTVRELLGHKTLTMTLRYAHLAPSHKVKAVDILDSTLSERSTIQKLYKIEGAANA
jgi:integrase